MPDVIFKDHYEAAVLWKERTGKNVKLCPLSDVRTMEHSHHNLNWETVGLQICYSPKELKQV